MKASDTLLIAFNNLKRNVMRTALTTLGVAVGVGALASMISFGQGLAGNISKSLESNDIFTGFTMSSRNIDFDNFGNRRNTIADEGRKIVPLDDSVVAKLKTWPEVAMVFPEVIKPVAVSFAGRTVSTNIKGVPSDMATFSPFNKIARGRFFENSNEPSVVISKSLLNQMNILIEGDKNVFFDQENVITLPADSIVGKDIDIITKVFDIDKIDLMRSSSRELPIKNEVINLRIVGIVESSSFSAGIFNNGVFVPSDIIPLIPYINLDELYDVIDGNQGKFGKYNSVHVRVKEHKYLKPVKYQVEKLGFKVFSIGDKLDDIEKMFFMLDSILAAIGTVALLVSILGIVNTLLMSIYERRKEIGIMKSFGATRIQIKMIFYFEAALIGLSGGLLGVLGGKIVSQAASGIANSQIGKLIDCDIEFFQFSWLLVLVSVLFAVVISVLASIYPASKASRIDPLDALRRE